MRSRVLGAGGGLMADGWLGIVDGAVIMLCVCVVRVAGI